MVVLLAARIKIGRLSVRFTEEFADLPELLEDGSKQLLRGCGRGIQNFDSHLFDAKHVSRETCHLGGVEHQRILLIAAIFRIELAWIEGRVEVAWIGVGVAIHRCSRAVQRALYIINSDEMFAGFR